MLPVIVSVHAMCTTLLSSAFLYTCASVANFVPSFVASVVFAVPSAGSVLKVFFAVIVCCVDNVTKSAVSTPSNSS